MQNIDLLISAKWIVPVEPEGRVLEDHSIAVQGGRILALLPNAEAEARYRPEIHHRLTRHALIPGLINAHTHASMTLLRGLADDLPLMEWLKQHIWPAEQQWVSEEFVHDGTLLAAAEMLRGGTTCFNDMYFFPEVSARALSHAGMRAVVGLIVLDFPSAWAQDAEEYLEKGIAIHDEYRDDPLIHTAFAPHGPYTVSDGPFERIRIYSNELELPVHIHLHESRDEIRESIDRFGVRPLERLERLGLVSPYLAAVHMTQLTPDEIELMQRCGAHVVHCPESNLKLASGFCPVAQLLEAGVNVALGTDGTASNNDLDLFGEMRTAALLGKAVADDAGALPAEQALRMATINGARALGLDDRTGSLVPDKAADIVAVDLGSVETQPLYHLVSQLVYATGRHRVSDVWVNGQHLLNQRVLTTIEETELLEAASRWQARIQPYR